jgi:hypothetical protein
MPWVPSLGADKLKAFKKQTNHHYLQNKENCWSSVLFQL